MMRACSEQRVFKQTYKKVSENNPQDNCVYKIIWPIVSNTLSLEQCLVTAEVLGPS